MNPSGTSATASTFVVDPSALYAIAYAFVADPSATSTTSATTSTFLANDLAALKNLYVSSKCFNALDKCSVALKNTLEIHQML